jgi:hypothetical protein
MFRRARISACIFVCAAVPLGAIAQSGNPLEGDPAAIRAGAALYASRCAD